MPQSPRLTRPVQLAIWLCGLICASPLLGAETLPLLDLPQHLATVRILRDLDTPGWGLTDYYTVDFGRTQYLGWYLAAVGLSHMMSVVAAAKLLLIAYVVALPWSMVALLRAFGRPPVVALLAAPLAWNGAFWLGYVNYVSALPLVLWWLAAVQQALDGEPLAGRPRLALWLQAAAWPLLLWLLHVQALLHGSILVLLVLLTHPLGWRTKRVLQVALSAVPAAGLFVAWALTSALVTAGTDWQASRAGHNAQDPLPRWQPLQQQLVGLPDHVMGALANRQDRWVLLALLLAIVVMALGPLWPRPKSPDSESDHHAKTRAQTRTLWLLSGVSLTLYFVLPTRYRWVYSINTRTLPLTGLLLLAAASRPGMAQRPWLAAGVVLSMVLAAVLGGPVRQFSERSQGVRNLLRQVPTGQRGLAVLQRSDSALFRHQPYLHIAQYAVLERGGMVDFSFANFPQSPVVFKPPGPPLLPPRFEKNPNALNLATDGRYYNWFLVRLKGNDLPDKFAAELGKSLRQVHRSADWVLLVQTSAHRP